MREPVFNDPTLKSLSTVFKVRISFAIVLCAIAGMTIMPGPALPIEQTLVLALAVFLSSSAAGAFNHFVERDLDAANAENPQPTICDR